MKFELQSEDYINLIEILETRNEYINNVLSTVSELTDYHEKLWKEQKNIVKILNIFSNKNLDMSK